MRVFEGLQAVLDTYEIEISLIPSWIPEGYSEADVRTFDTPKQRQFSAKYQDGDKTIKIWIEDYLDSEPVQIEQDETVVEIYESAGVKYYIFSDVDSLQAAWVRENYACYISGPLSLAEIKQMIDSIEKG